MKQLKVAHEVADAEFERWADAMEIDTDTAHLDEEDIKAFNDFRHKFITRIKTGALSVGDDEVLTFTARGTDKPLTFDEPDGGLLSARRKNDTDEQATRRMLAQWTGAEPKTFAEMKLRDFNFCASLLGFFAGS